MFARPAPHTTQHLLLPPRFRSSISIMAKAKETEFEKLAPAVDDEDEQTLAAIDEGVRDAKAGRTVSPQEVRKLLPKWTTASSTRRDR
jgi:predicted transcriptional regulator